MEQYIQCGDIAENPLYVKELGIHIYTAEEFCYYIFNNTYLLGEDFIRQEVIDFFRVELHMPELADKIVKFYGSSADMGADFGNDSSVKLVIMKKTRFSSFKTVLTV